MIDRERIVVKSDTVTVTVPEHLALPPQEFMAAMKPYLTMALDEIKVKVRAKMPVGATGNLKRSVARIVETMPNELRGRVYVPAGLKAGGYAYFVEYGRNSGSFPPFKEGSPLYAWAKTKITSGKFQKTGKAVGKSISLEQEISSFAYLVARKIYKQGTKAQSPMDLGWAEAQPKVDEIIDFGVQSVNR